MEHEIDPVAAMRIEDDGGQWVTIHNCRTCGVLVMDHLVDTHRAFFAGVKGQQAVFTPGMVEAKLGVSDSELPPNPDMAESVRLWVDKQVVVKLNGELQYTGAVQSLIVDEQQGVAGFEVLSDRAGAAVYRVDLLTPGLTVELR
jgi:hypothetical protein